MPQRAGGSTARADRGAILTHKICMIGPSAAGKTSLLASLKACLDKGTHGYPRDHRFFFRELDAPSTAADFGSALSTGRLDELREQYVSQYEHDMTSGTGSSAYRIGVALRKESGTANGAEEHECIVTDAAGELISPEAWGELSEIFKTEEDKRGPQQQALQTQINELRENLSTCDTLLLAAPLFEYEDYKWAGQLRKILPDLLDSGKTINLRHVIVAWTKLDELLGPYGWDAAAIASNRQCLKRILQLTIDQYEHTAKLLEDLRNGNLFQGTTTDTDGKRQLQVTHLAVSNPGFLKESGAMHLQFKQQPDTYRSIRFDARPASALAEVWMPYLTADPFLIALFGRDRHGLSFSHEELTGQDQDMQLADDPGDLAPARGGNTDEGRGLLSFFRRRR